MRYNLVSYSLAATLTCAVAAPAFSQIVIDNGPQDPYSVDANTESQFLNAWNRNYDAQRQWNGRRANFGPDDVVTLLEDRGYRVRDVQDVGPRFLVQATRDGDHLLVSVSRAGEIVGVVHDRY